LGRRDVAVIVASRVPGEPHRSRLEFELELISREDTEAHSVDEAICRRRER
jgi:hypothetical protein